jgi:hypothetical protein
MKTYDYNELYHYGVPGMKWGKRKKVEYAGEGIVSRQKPKLPGPVLGGPKKPKLPGPVLGGPKKLPSPEDRTNDLKAKIKKEIKKRSNSEIANRGKSALDVLMNGDKDWMGNSISSNDMPTELRNRGKAALERLMYSQDQIDNKKFFGDYNPFD